MASPYNCPRHAVPLVARVLVVTRVKRDGTRTVKRVKYFACPVHGCLSVKSDKWENRRMYDNKS